MKTRKFKYEVKYAESCDKWFVVQNGVTIQQFDEQGLAMAWVQQALEDERHPNY